ncbi:MAG: group III truncated hemoglobin [Sulfurovum sp.]|nr:group III truncated hemoglobin [Sulfurovum sp.]
MAESVITRDNIARMVNLFYIRVLKDDEVGPFFVEKLGDDIKSEIWQSHLELLTNFWSSIALGDNSYYGNPFAPHMQLDGLRRETFSQWLSLFHDTLDSIYEPEVAILFKERSTMIAGNFMRNLGLYQ